MSVREQTWFERNPKKTILALFVVVLLGLTYGAEKILQYRSHGMGFNFALPYRAVRLREYRPLMSMYVYPEEDQRKGYSDSLVFKNYLLRIDQDGFVIPSQKYSHPDLSLAFLGGSTTECRFVDEKNRFPYLAGVELEKKLGCKINSYNAGRSGNHSLHSIDVLLNKVFPLNPKIVVMMHNINDMMILLYENSYWNKNSSRSVLLDMNKEIAINYFRMKRDKYIPYLAAALRNFNKTVRGLWRGDNHNDHDEFAHIRGKKIVIHRDRLLAQFKMNLQSFISLCQARGVTPVLMTMASRIKEPPDKKIAAFMKEQMTISYQDFKGLFDAFNDAIRQKARENHVLVIDLARQVPQEKEFLYDTVHFNDQGSIKVADIVSASLEPLVKQALQKR
jgi:hypothetical protein